MWGKNSKIYGHCLEMNSDAVVSMIAHLHCCQLQYCQKNNLKKRISKKAKYIIKKSCTNPTILTHPQIRKKNPYVFANNENETLTGYRIIRRMHFCRPRCILNAATKKLFY